MSKTALVLVQNELIRDPRVRRQIDWLGDAGWTVDSVGLGPTPGPSVRHHVQMTDAPAWTNSKLGSFLLYFLLPHRLKFRALTVSRVARAVRERIRSGEYDLIVFNDTHFVPWVKDPATFTPAARRAHLHLDVHEYFPIALKRDTLWRFATGPYFAWVRRLIGDPAFTTRSTVADGIADLYRDELGIERPHIIRNSPPFDQVDVSPVGERIQLLHHGMASWDRGFRDLVAAMRLVEDRFDLTFMLTGSEAVIGELREISADLGDRVRIVPPVPMREISAAINGYDLEVLFYWPATRNLEFALPNKFFEAVQGRLGLVIGESPSMMTVLEQHGNGVVAHGWTPADLAAALDALTPDRVAELKAGSDRAARELSAEAEGERFLALVEVS